MKYYTNSERAYWNIKNNDVNDINENAHDKKFFNNALRTAILYEDIEMIKALSSCYNNINCIYEDGSTSLIVAAYRNRTSETIQTIIECGARINTTNCFSWTALYWAAYNGNQKVCKILIEAGADEKIKNDQGFIALGLAKAQRHVDISNTCSLSEILDIKNTTYYTSNINLS